uniref:NADH-ubiquinone oxidoreductase chain 3 n=1 Tax=Sepedophilus bipunctatus TaxID=1143114 RepID=A0A0S2M8C6_9COLE|nr:NADH dehydrogenase subunit 3 [Sepedophilus bipunctatus]ALO70929.1 NADH deshydrogenase subunit 3 [Sepedophilus bipunctatus]
MMSLLIMIISMMVMMLASMISKKTFMDREKSSPFECGFDPKSNSRLPFSLQFFLIAVMFLIFDVEITLLMPLILVLKTSMISNFFFINLTFILILLGGLYHEWNQGMLNWSK